MSFSYTWQRCGVTCVDVATGPYYIVQSADVDEQLQVAVTATSIDGSNTATSLPVVAGPGVPTGADPSLSDDPPQEGVTITAIGNWTTSQPPLATTYQWSRCAAVCTPIPGATNASYIPAASDVGLRLLCHLAATDSIGDSVSANTEYSGYVRAAVPTVSVAPTVVQTTAGMLDIAAGTWISSIAYYVSSVTWERCDGAGSSCASVATGHSRYLGPDDVGSTYRALVTVSNASGSATPIETAP
jgi:hypothetical protein